jgi:hypothetical protein
MPRNPRRDLARGAGFRSVEPKVFELPQKESSGSSPVRMSEVAASHLRRGEIFIDEDHHGAFQS